MRAVRTEPGGMVASPAMVIFPEYIAGSAVNGVGVLVGSATIGGTVATTGAGGVGVSSGSGVGEGVTRCGKVRTIPVLNACDGGSGGPGK